MPEEEFKRIHVDKPCREALDQNDLKQINEKIANINTRKLFFKDSRFHIIDTHHLLANVEGQFLFHTANYGEN